MCRKISTTDRAILDLKVLRRNLAVRSKALEAKIRSERDAYTKYNANNVRANLVLRHIKALENALSQCRTYFYHVDGLLLDMSDQETLVQVVNALKDGKEAMARMNALLNVQDVEKLLEDGAVARQEQLELEDCLSQTLTNDFDVTEDEVSKLKQTIVQEADIPPSVPSRVPGEECERNTALLHAQ